jgi:hypothetical protein
VVTAVAALVAMLVATTCAAPTAAPGPPLILPWIRAVTCCATAGDGWMAVAMRDAATASAAASSQSLRL